jgi:hypothetical protein
MLPDIFLLAFAQWIHFFCVASQIRYYAATYVVAQKNG